MNPIRCKEMDFEDTLVLELEALDDEEQGFISVISDYILQQKQRKVIEQKLGMIKQKIPNGIKGEINAKTIKGHSFR